jgi:hypothetical protein
MNENEEQIRNILIEKYKKYMKLKIYINNQTHPLLYAKYRQHINEHNKSLLISSSDLITRTVDLISPGDMNHPGKKLYAYPGKINRLDYHIICKGFMVKHEHVYNCAFTINPHPTLMNTQLRLSSPGHIINPCDYDSLKIGFDVLPKVIDNQISLNPFVGNQFDRYIQITGPELCPIYIEMIDLKKIIPDDDNYNDIIEVPQEDIFIDFGEAI